MSDFIISIKPQFAQAILCGTKTLELRRRRINTQPGDVFLIHATRPVSAIVGSFEVAGIISAPLMEFWERHHAQTGISFQCFFDYYRGCDFAHAIQIANPRAHDPFSPTKNYIPPQSYCKYVR
jgi:predicted transcriptional regulator